MQENGEIKIDISLENPISQTLKIEYVNESDRKVKVEKLNPHTNIKIYNGEKQLIPQNYGSFAQGIPSYFELNSNSKMQHHINLRKNYEISPEGSYYLTYRIHCEFIERSGSDVPHHFYLEGTTKINFDDKVVCATKYIRSHRCEEKQRRFYF
jgi:hypothetical protein